MLKLSNKKGRSIMENALNLNGGWEEVVNRKERRDRIDAICAEQEQRREAFYAARKQHRIDKLYQRVWTCGLGIVTMGTLLLTGLVSGWVAIPAVIALAGVSSFMLGKVSELEK